MFILAHKRAKQPFVAGISKPEFSIVCGNITSLKFEMHKFLRYSLKKSLYLHWMFGYVGPWVPIHNVSMILLPKFF